MSASPPAAATTSTRGWSPAYRQVHPRQSAGDRAQHAGRRRPGDDQLRRQRRAKDGLHIGAPQRGIPFEPLLGDHSNAKFDAVKLNWVGSANTDTSVAVVHKRTGVKTWQDLRTRTSDLIVAGTGIGTESVTVPYILRNLLGFKYRVIAGYPGGSEMNLAMLRGEVDGRGTFSWTSLKPHLKEWIDTGEIDHPLPAGPAQASGHSEDPAGDGADRGSEIKKVLTVQFTAFELGRPYFVGEGVPADRVAAIRNAFNMVMKDKDLLADADKLNQEVNPFTGEEMQKVLAEVYATPKNLIERLANATKSKPDLKVLESSKTGEKK